MVAALPMRTRNLAGILPTGDESSCSVATRLVASSDALVGGGAETIDAIRLLNPLDSGVKKPAALQLYRRLDFSLRRYSSMSRKLHSDSSAMKNRGVSLVHPWWLIE